MVGLLISATEPYSLFPPCVTSMVNREVIGIVTKCEQQDANPDRAENWLRLSGCKKVFRADSVTGFGINELITYLNK
jgi:ethanolamine utilization protein EutP